jgi:sulfatase maturation enzyme AslB (radical SAM superfamily)
MQDFSPLPLAAVPIYRNQGNDASLYYAPGYLLRVEKWVVPMVEEQILNPDVDLKEPNVITLFDHAVHAKTEWENLLERPYNPQSLHVYLNRRCQLACQYCFSDLPKVTDPAEVSVEAVCAAAKLVAKNCAGKNLPLVVVFHGGGEPVLSWRLIDTLQPELRRIADAHGLTLFRYIATNGVMTEQRARWLARSFDLVGLSIDGPSDIQSVQRPYRNSDGDNTIVILRTARILREAGTPVHVRVTLTSRSALRQAEICRYLCDNISPRAVSVEPVYLGGHADASMLIQEEHLEGFVASYFEARTEAHFHGVDWQMSGARLADVHGPYCNIFRQVLQLTPDDVASVCFKDVSEAQADKRGMLVGRFNGDAQLDEGKIGSLHSVFARPKVCETCFLGYHCTYDCPNACLLMGESKTDILCRLLKNIFSRRLIGLGKELGHVPGGIVGVSVANG